MLVGYLDHPHEIVETGRYPSNDHILDELRKRGIRFDRILVDVIAQGRYHWSTGTWRSVEGPCHYFMRGNADVGWYCTGFGTLNLQRTPRIWGEEALWQAMDISGRYGIVPAMKIST